MLRTVARGLLFQMNRDQCSYLFRSLTLLLLLSLVACGRRSPSPSEAPQTKVEGGSKFSKVTLKQTNEKGQLLWKLEAQKVTYGEDISIAQVQGLQGQLYENGQPAFEITAEKGEIKQSGQVISLKGQIVATELKNKLVFKSAQLQWQPELGLLQARSGITVTHPSLQMWAQRLQASSRTQQVRAQGKVVLETRPTQFRLKTDQLVWQIDQQFLTAGAGKTNATTPRVEIEQLQGSSKGSRAFAGSVRLNLKGQIATLQNPAQIKISSPPIELTSQQLVWDIKRQVVSSKALLEVRDQQQGIKVIANRGIFNQGRQIVQFNGQVQATGLRNGSRLNTDQLIWQLATQRIDAQGDVRYIQSDPPFRLQGPRAVGKIQAQTIQISGGNVVTEIIP
ncbi:MAG: LPS export ABC transporter periplasmic protein LptC [Thermosynechococcaceae cyanobacterium]